jgi:hexosaminidase
LRATLPQIAHDGIKLINCNFYYLYVIGRPKMYTADSKDFWQRALMSWNPNVWDNDNLQNMYHGKQTIGSSLCLWGDSPQHYRATKAYDLNRDYVNIYLNH